MKLKGKNILLISPESWEHIFVSKHHYATHLAERGNKVIFLNPPSKYTGFEKTDYKNVFSVNYKGFINGLRWFPRFLQKQLIKKKFEELERFCNTKFDLIWSFDNSVFYDLSALSNSIYKISHIVDLNQDFQFKKSTKTADLCLATSEFISQKQKRYNDNSHNIGHGFNKVEHQSSAFKLRGVSKINCGYAGNLDIKYIDWDLVKSLINDFPHINFHFAGQWNSKAKFPHICNKSNFHFYGKLPSNDLPFFYEKLDILILLYQYQKYPEQLANPHKMMEYLGSGKMIVATWTEEYKDHDAVKLILMSNSTADFLDNFKSASYNLKYWNSTEKKNGRKAFAAENTYTKQIERIEKLING